MRVIHFADLHIGVETYGRPLDDRGWSSRMQDFLDAFDTMVDYAIDEQVDAIIFAGDAYKAREPSQTHQREFAARIRRLSEAEIPTFLLVGNHDLPNAYSRAHALEIFRTLDVPNVYVGDNAWFEENGLRPRVLPTKAGPLQVAFLPWPQIPKLLAADDRVAGMTTEQVNHAVEEKMQQAIAVQAAELDPDLPSLLTCHVTVNDFIVHNNPGSEHFMSASSGQQLLKSSLSASHFDYIALGHHHNNMDLKTDTPTWYAGSMQAVDFGEEGQDKGFMVLDIDPAKPLGQRVGGSGLPRLQSIDPRPFVTVRVKPKDDDPTPEVCRAVEAADIHGSILRVYVELSAEQDMSFRRGDVKSAARAAHTLAYVRTETPRAAPTQLPPGIQPDSSAPLETLETYLRARTTEPLRQRQLLTRAEELLEEVE